MWQVKRSVYTQQHLAVYMSVASKNTGMQRVKTPVKTPFLLTFFQDRIAILLSLRIPIRTETLANLKWGNIQHSHDAQSDNCILEGNGNHKVFFIFSNNFSLVFQKLTRKCHKISIKILKHLYEVFSTFFQIFFRNFSKISKKDFRYFFIISRISII